MKTEWDYTQLAASYVERPQYSPCAFDALIGICGLKKLDSCADIGAGVGHASIPLAERGLTVQSIEPNDAMRNLGRSRTRSYSNIHWNEGTAEITGLPDSSQKLVTFGSSFNVCDQNVALSEMARILESNGWLACFWNHRDLEDPLQRSIEEVIAQHVSSFDYGTRRQNQEPLLRSCTSIRQVHYLELAVVHQIHKDSIKNAWRSHATLQRQTEATFNQVLLAIDKVIDSCSSELIDVPYKTKMWLANFE